jgi:16S rRNA (guanine1516-N2)-methyltransferase
VAKNAFDLAIPSLVYRLKYGRGGEAIAKAIKLKNHQKLTKVIDATAGFGTDSFILANLNCQVYAIERNHKIFSLLQSKILKAKEHDFLAKISKNITLIHGDARDVIPEIIKQYDFTPDVIYLDPMFPIKKKTAANNKQIQLLKSIIKESSILIQDDKDLLKNCLNFAKHRVVVKRPRVSSYLEDIKPSFSLIGKANRFDVYVKLITQ